MTKIHYALIAVIIVLIGTNVFSGNDNWELRKQLKERDAREAIYLDSISTRNQAIAERDTLIAKSQIIVDSLENKWSKLNERIVSDFPTRDVVVSLSIDSQISVLSEFLSQADSLQR